jgi:hypothetical protein
MTELIVDRWPPEPLVTERLVLRESREQDRDGLINMLTSDDARRYLGGRCRGSELSAALLRRTARRLAPS